MKTVMLAFAIAMLTLWAAPIVGQEQPQDDGVVLQDVFRDDTPPDLLEDIAYFDSRQSMAAEEALGRVIDRGPAQVPAILAALDDVASNDGTDAQAHFLVRAFAVLADAGHAEQFVDIARRLNAKRLVPLDTYDALHAIGAADVADALALEVISNAEDNQFGLLAALMRYWYAAPVEAAEAALQHVENERQVIRSGAYRVAFVGGLSDRIRDQIVEDVANVDQIKGGVVTMMNVMAAMEPVAEFQARVEPLDLRPGVRRAALLMNEFSWADDAGKVALIPRMLRSDTSELRSTAIAYMLRSDRGDLLVEHQLAGVNNYDPFDIYRENFPGFDGMSRQERVDMIGEETLTLLEALVEEIGTVTMDRHARYVATRLGYTVVTASDGVSVQIQSASIN